MKRPSQEDQAPWQAVVAKAAAAGSAKLPDVSIFVILTDLLTD